MWWSQTGIGGSPVGHLEKSLESPVRITAAYWIWKMCIRDSDASAVSSFTEKSQREIKRMEDVIYNLMKLARLDAGIIQMEKAPENLSVLRTFYFP